MTQNSLSINFNSPNRLYLPRSSNDDLAKHFMYTSVQQSTYDEVPWVSKIPVPSTTYKINGFKPLYKSNSLHSRFDNRSKEILQWDRTQLRKDYFQRKPIEKLPPLKRAEQISGYSGSIGGDNIQDIDNPNVDFQPYTIVRSEREKFSSRSNIFNIPNYTGKTHWTKMEPVSHYDKFGHGYTTTATFHKPLPIDKTFYRHSNIYGDFSRSVTTTMPQNPYNRINSTSLTLNSSLDSRPSVVIRDLPRKTYPKPISNDQK